MWGRDFEEADEDRIAGIEKLEKGILNKRIAGPLGKPDNLAKSKKDVLLCISRQLWLVKVCLGRTRLSGMPLTVF